MSGSLDPIAVLRASRPVIAPDIAARRVVWRGQPVQVLHNPATGKYFRAAPRLHALVASLDGRQTVAQALACLPPDDGGGDEAELLQALPQLLHAGILRIPGVKPPAPRRPGLLGLVGGVAFTRLRLVDLGPALPWLDPWLGRLYTRGGVAVMLALWLLAGWLLSGRGTELGEQFRRLGTLDAGEVALGYALFLLAKLLHECGHALAASRMARAEGYDARVFPAGISFMFLLPAPYVDASSAWFLESRWRRAAVGLGGVWMDLSVAALATLAWTAIGPGHAGDVLFGLILICTVSSLLFNLNPLVRLDGYHVAGDLLEIDNLFQRAQQAFGRLAGAPFGLARARRGDLPLAAWASAAWLYRWTIYLGIFWLAGGLHPALAVGVAVVVGLLFGGLPLQRLARRLPGIFRHAPGRASLAAALLLALLGAAALLPLPVRLTAHGIAWHEGAALVFPRSDARLVQVAVAGPVAAGPVIALDNPEASRLLAQLRSEAAGLALEARRLRADGPGRVDSVEERARAVAAQIEELEREIASWTVTAPAGALWEPLRAEVLGGTWVRRDEQRPLGALFTQDRVVLRFVLDQWDGPAALAALAAAPEHPLPLRRRGEGPASFSGSLLSPRPDARDELPSGALGLPAGGPIAVRADARGELRPVERVFELRVAPHGADPASLPHGMRVEARIDLPPAPLLEQLWHRGRQLLQRRLAA